MEGGIHPSGYCLAHRVHVVTILNRERVPVHGDLLDVVDLLLAHGVEDLRECIRARARRQARECARADRREETGTAEAVRRPPWRARTSGFGFGLG